MAFINLQPGGLGAYEAQSFVTPQVLVSPNDSPAILIPDGWGGARAFKVPKGIGRGVQGLGQAGCFAGGFAQNMQEWLAGIQLPGPDAQLVAAVGCGPGASQPCASPADAANQAIAIAKSWCDESNAQSWMGCPSDPNCGDGGAAAAAPYVSQALAVFSRFPASVWAASAADAASGNYYGTSTGPCPPGYFLSVANGVQTCNPPGQVATQPTGDSGPQIIIGATTNPVNPFGTSCPSGQCAKPITDPHPPPYPQSPATPTTAVLTNLTAPGQQLEVGDQWQLVITGPANSSVTGSSTQNGGTPSTNNFGSTDSTGKLTLGGTFGPGDQGAWLETWTVSGGTSTQVSFVVAPAGQSNPAAGTSSSTSTGSGFDLSFLSNDVSVGGYQIPIWGIAAVAIVGLMVVKK